MDDRVKVAQIEALIREYVYVNPNSVAPANLHGVSQAAGLIAKTFQLAAARSAGTGRSEAEDEPDLPAGEPITEEASEAALIVAQEIETAIQVRGIFSYAPDGRPCLTWYGEQRIAKVIDAHLEEVPKPAFKPPAREGEGDHG